MSNRIIGAAHLLNDCLRANRPHAVEALDLFLATLPIAFSDLKDLEAIEKTFAPWRNEAGEGWMVFTNRLKLRRENAADMGHDPEDVCDHCEKCPAMPMHTCPFEMEIYNKDSECNCCDGCRRDCAMDI